METKEILDAIQKAAETIATPNWADILSVVLSLLAVTVAGVVAWKQSKISREQASIADKQNKIALFEKRLEIYNILSSCSSSVRILEVADNSENILKYLFIILSDNSKKQNKSERNEVQLHLANCSAKLMQARFFFSEGIASYIADVSIELLILAHADVEKDGQEKFNEKKQRYFEAVNNLDKNKVFTNIRDEMKMI